jgi:hypothetical protein
VRLRLFTRCIRLAPMPTTRYFRLAGNSNLNLGGFSGPSLYISSFFVFNISYVSHTQKTVFKKDVITSSLFKNQNRTDFISPTRGLYRFPYVFVYILMISRTSHELLFNLSHNLYYTNKVPKRCHT